MTDIVERSSGAVEGRSTAVVPKRYEQGRDDGEGRSAGSLLLKTFLAFVVLPTVAVFIYYAAFASDVFVTEAKITVRSASDTSAASGAMSLLSQFGLSEPSNSVQDSYMILDYIKSRAIIADIGGRDRLEPLFSSPEIDWYSRLERDADFEDVWDYWRDRVYGSVETRSGILTLRVHAYRPADALQLSQEIIDRSEKLVNEISLRSRQDSLERSQQEVERASAELAEARANLLDFQSRNNAISPLDTAKRIGELLSELMRQRVALEGEIATAVASGVASGPGMEQVRSRLKVVNDQITAYEGLLTSQSNDKTVANQLKEYELLKLNQEFSERKYTISRAGYEEARRKLSSQGIFLALVVPPLEPEEALFPRVLTNTALAFAGLLILWGIGSLVGASIRDHMI